MYRFVKLVKRKECWPFFFCDKGANENKSKREQLYKEYESREKGYFTSLVSAVEYMSEHKSQELTLDFIQRLHFQAISKNGTVKEKCNITKNVHKTGFSNEVLGFSIWFTENGYKHTVKMIEKLLTQAKIPGENFYERFIIYNLEEHYSGCSGSYKKFQYTKKGGVFTEHRYLCVYDMYKPPNNIYRWKSRLSADERRHLTSAIVENYNNTIKKFSDDKKKLEACLEAAILIELVHGFADANCRLAYMLLLQHLLIINNLSPFVLTFDPNELPGKEMEECVKMIQLGQEQYKKLWPFTNLSDSMIFT